MGPRYKPRIDVFISEPVYGTRCICTCSFSAEQTSSSPTRAAEGALKHQYETNVLLPCTGLNWPSEKTYERRLDDDIKADLKIRLSFEERLLLSQDRL